MRLGPRDPDAPPAAPAAATAPGPAARVPWSRQPLVLGGAAVGLLAFGVVLGVLVVRFAGPAPADPMAGMPGMAGVPGMADIAEPSASVTPSAAPDSSQPIPTGMLEGMLRAAHSRLDAGRYQEAIAAYKAVLKREPKNVDAITHLGAILAIAGHADGALEALDRALAINPDYLHALWDKARVLEELRQDYAGAIAVWERVVKVSRADQDRKQALTRIREAKARLAAAPPPSVPAPPGSNPEPKPSGSAPAGSHPDEARHDP